MNSDSAENWADYWARRQGLISERLKTTAAANASNLYDCHDKAGCFDCDWLWAGEQTRFATTMHHESHPSHATWIIEAPKTDAI